MSFSTSAAAVCLIACHGGPADHFATFAERLSKNVGTIEIHASGPALKKFQERGIEVTAPFSIDHISSEEEDRLAEQIAKTCSTASVIITDVGHVFEVKIQKALARQAPHVSRLAYYDNPEPYVPGGYSAVAAEVMLAANGILFANSNLAKTPIFQEPGKEIDLGNRQKVGIGYYPIHQAEKIAKRRAAEQLSMRKTVFSNNGLVDTGQKVIVYFGGNNEEYFSKALPAFLSLLEEGIEQTDFSNLVVIIQQHPGAKSKNLDGIKVAAWMDKHRGTKQAPRMILSDFSSDDAQTIADGALYYQTSMGPQFVLAGIPTIQVAHETFEDILVRNQLIPSATNLDQFITVINNLTYQQKEISQEIILEGLGIKSNWLSTLEQAIQGHHEMTLIANE
jgi:hypothetical protein